jgi:hypothetical protein
MISQTNDQLRTNLVSILIEGEIQAIMLPSALKALFDPVPLPFLNFNWCHTLNCEEFSSNWNVMCAPYTAKGFIVLQN